MRDWIIALVTAVIMVTTALVAAVLILSDRKKQQQPSKQWNVELWSIDHGYRICLHFGGSMILGRFSLLQNAACDYPIQSDATISRDHVMLYEQNGLLWAWNLSKVNPAMLSGRELNVPQQLMPGNRLKMGNSEFLVTEVRYGSSGQ